FHRGDFKTSPRCEKKYTAMFLNFHRGENLKTLRCKFGRTAPKYNKCKQITQNHNIISQSKRLSKNARRMPDFR
ncbi:MAG: hypothetical protein LUD00_05130, partial [Prevotellaceae bacterium]|nr:hypothetical protein [Prevotellaceae bacterium]